MGALIPMQHEEDSGWIQLNNTTGNKVNYRKINGIVYVNVDSQSVSSGTNVLLGNIPSGYRPVNTVNATMLENTGAAVSAMIIFASASGSYVAGDVVARIPSGSLIRGSICYPV